MSSSTINIIDKYPDTTSFMDAFWAGEPEAFQCIDRQLRRELVQSAENWLYSTEDARDIAATAIGKLYFHRAKIESAEHIRRWLFTAVRNSSIDHLCRRQRRRSIMKDLLYILRSSEDSTVLPEERHRMLAECLAKALSKLSERRRTILRLYFFEQKKTGEIAKMLKLSNQTVLNHKSVALRSLRLRVPASLRS